MADSWVKTSLSGRFLRPHFQNSFPLTFVCSTQNSKMYRNMCNLRHKVRNGQNLPHYESSNFTNFFLKSDFTYNFSYFFASLKPHFKIFFLFSTLNSRMSKNMCIWRHKLYNAKTGVGPTLTRSNEP